MWHLAEIPILAYRAFLRAIIAFTQTLFLAVGWGEGRILGEAHTLMRKLEDIAALATE